MPDTGDDTDIVTARLRLRRARMEDLPAIHAILSDCRAMLYWSTLPHATLDQSRAWLADMVAAIAHNFAHHPIDAILADVDPRNAASLGLLGSLGFVETGRASNTILVGDDWCDSIYLARARVTPRL